MLEGNLKELFDEAVKNPSYGYPPPKCQLCNEPITDLVIDGRIYFQQRTTWAWTCPTCYGLSGVGFGTGKGQLYALNTEDGNWIKIKG